MVCVGGVDFFGFEVFFYQSYFCSGVGSGLGLVLGFFVGFFLVFLVFWFFGFLVF